MLSPTPVQIRVRLESLIQRRCGITPGMSSWLAGRTRKVEVSVTGAHRTRLLRVRMNLDEQADSSGCHSGLGCGGLRIAIGLWCGLDRPPQANVTRQVRWGIARRSRVWRVAFSKMWIPHSHSYERCPEFSNSRRDSWHSLRQGFEIVEEPPKCQGADIWRERKRMLASMHHLQTL